jgi:hypothetical protein
MNGLSPQEMQMQMFSHQFSKEEQGPSENLTDDTSLFDCYLLLKFRSNPSRFQKWLKCLMEDAAAFLDFRRNMRLKKDDAGP